MLGSPEPLREARADIYRRFQKDEISAEDAVARLRDIEPSSPLAAVMLANSLFTAGDLDRAEQELWTAVTGAPNIPGGWFRLAAIYEQRADDPRAALAFRLLGISQLALSDEIPDEDAAMFSHLGDAARHPPAYSALADVAEKTLGDYSWPERLLPFRLLRVVQRDAHVGLDPDVLRDILDHYDACAPVFRAALRQWSDDDGSSLSDEAASLLLALLGERGGPELIDDIFPDEQYPTTEVLTHAQWAVRRIGQRYPAEAFARLQSLAATADVTTRGFLAEQFYFLPAEVAGRRQAIRALLDGSFPDPDDPADSAYLLLTVSTLLALLGAPADSRAVLEKHRRRLPDEGRRVLQENLEAEEGFVPDLCAQGIDEISLEQVVMDLALAPAEQEGEDDDLEDYEDDDLDFDDDYTEPAVAECRPGRNDPCWCGSGKKYKKCHLESDDSERRAAASSSLAVFRKVVNDIMENAVSRMNRADSAAAHRFFFDSEPGFTEHDPDESAAFLQWLVLDHRNSSGRTGVEEYLRRRGRLPEEERAIVDALRDARFALWEIQRIEKGRGVEVKDYFGDERLFVHDVTTSKESARWDCLIAYFFQREGRWEFFSDGISVPRLHLPRIAERVDAGARETGVSPSAYFRSRSHEWRRFVQQAYSEWRENLQLTNTAGDPLEFCSARYDALDAAAAESALLACNIFAAEKPGNLVWLETGEAEDSRVFGHIEIAEGKLTLECNSRKRLAVGRQLVEKHAGDFLRHVEDECKQLDRTGAASASPAPDPIPAEIQEALVLEFKSKHYATWPDEPLPALGGRTPREAVRSETGRRAVEDLLRDFENDEDRQQRSGGPAFDFGPLRKELGLA